MKSLQVCSLLLSLVLALPTTANSAFVASTPQYEVNAVPGGSMTVGNIRFSNFAVDITGNVPSLPTSFLVQAGMDGSNVGLRFSPQNFLAITDQFINASLRFQITSLPPTQDPKLTGVDMTLTGVSTIGEGIVTIGESVMNTSNLLDPPIANLSVVAMQGISPVFLHDDETFAPQTSLYIRKDILLSGGSSVGAPGFGVAHLSEFFQIYNTGTAVIPEPSSIGFTVATVLGAGWFYKRRRKAEATA